MASNQTDPLTPEELAEVRKILRQRSFRAPTSATRAGYVTTGTQTIAGDKTFSGDVSITGATTVDDLDVGGDLGVTGALTFPLADGRVLVGSGAGAATAVDSASVGDIDADTIAGLTIKAASIDDTGLFAAGAEADGTHRGVVSIGAQSIAGAKTFADLVTCTSGIVPGSGSSTLSTYLSGTSADLWTKGVNTPSSTLITWKYVRIGDLLFMSNANSALDTKDGSAGAIYWSSVVPAAYQPSSTREAIGIGTVNGVEAVRTFALTSPGSLFMYNDVNKANIAAGTANCGLQFIMSMVFYIG